MPTDARTRPEIENARRPLARWQAGALVALALTAAACPPEPSCPGGKRKVGTRCVDVEDVNARCLVDEDGDGFGVDNPDGECRADVVAGDCDDGDPGVHPDAPDVCDDGKDNDCDGAIDEGEPELCNGIDDDCNGKVDDGVLVPFYPDRDGDGFGAGEAVFACVAPEGFVAERNDCDDGDRATSPAAEEVCDGLDNDCSGEPDDTFACARGQLTECTTQCGSTGTGMCTDACAPPTGNACTPPEESCNLIDDDCDGVADEGLWQRTATRVWRQEAASLGGLVALVPRTGGGAWLLYDAHLQGLGIQVRELDANGALVGTPPGATRDTAGSVYFAADGNDTWSVVAASEGDGTRIRLFSAEDFALVDDFLLEGVGDPYRVSMAADEAGTVRMLVITIGLDVRARVVTRTASGVWSVSQGGLLLSRSSQDIDCQVVRIPCRDEWLVITPDRDGTTTPPYTASVHRVDNSGAFVGPRPAATIYGAYLLWALGRSEEACADRDPELLVMAMRYWNSADEHETFAVRLRVSRTTGTVTTLSPEWSLGPYLGSGAILGWGGKWLVAGAHFSSPDGSSSEDGGGGGARLAEIEPTSVSVRWIDLLAQGGNPGLIWPYAPSRSGMLHAGGKLLVAFPRGWEGDLDQPHQQENPGSAEQPAAVTYAVGCP
jgi:hypothetical protein